jgi:alkyl sulfatase BDS1-like metallo-beta-lactamase superfamily hydrolase
MANLIKRLYLALGVASCAFNLPALAQTMPHAATPATTAANNAFSSTLPWADESETALSQRGFVATLADPKIRNAAGQVVLDLSAWDFATGPAPATANPSLWRHAGLLRQHGLFKVADKIWQVRGFDISVMSIIETDTGYLIVDPLTSVETARAAMGLVRQHVGNKPVKAVIYTHSHADHFGGVKGVVDPADVTSGKVQIIAPDGFMEHAVSENLIAGAAMSRRAAYQFGTPLEAGPAGHLGAGIGMRVPSGALSLIAPTYTVKATGETLVVDGLKIEFQYTPGTEAPSEMNFYLPDLKALCLAENANVTMHNILPPRGALVRDSKAWADYLSQSLSLYGARTDVMFVSHGWPRWGRAEINQYVSLHRDAYKYLHDQSVRLMNQGLNAAEISEQIALPEVLSRQWYNRGYYGTMRHNSRAVYQRYLGWYDGNPANLNNLPPEEVGKRYVAAMGGPRKALREATKAFDAGDYRWSSELAKHIVFADATNAAARELLAKSFEQMGYQAESMLWRNMYLVGAQEARATPTAPTRSTVALDLIGATQTGQLFDLLAIRVDPVKAKDRDVAVAFVFPERRERVRVTLRNSVLIHEEPGIGEVAATVTMPRAAFLGMLFAGTSPASLVQAGTMKIDGDRTVLQNLLGSLDGAGDGVPFPIVTP